MPQITLRPSQQKVSDFLVAQPHAAVFMDMGGGKTLTVLDVFDKVCPTGHVLLVAPLNIARSTWIDEIVKWGYQVRIQSFVEDELGRKYTKDQRHELYSKIATDPPSFYIINRELLRDLVDAMPTAAVQPGSRKKVPLWPFATVIVDESQGFKSRTSDRFKALSSVRPAISRMVLLTGTPMPGGYEDLWAQIYLLDQGAALGRTFTEYLQRYFVPVAYVKGRPVKYRLVDGAEKQIQDRIRHLCITADNIDLGLLEPDVRRHQVRMDPVAQKMYSQFKRDEFLKLSEDHQIDGSSAGVLRNRLLQFSSGTLYVSEDRQFITTHTAKLDELARIFREEIDTPALVAYRTQAEKVLIREMLLSMRVDVRVFDGSRQMVQQWCDRQVQAMIIHPASAGHGLNLQSGGRHMVWYGLPDSSEHYQQTNRRLQRPGQTQQVVIHELITLDTIDQTQPARLSNKISVEQQFKEAMMDVDPGISLGGPVREDAREDETTGPDPVRVG